VCGEASGRRKVVEGEGGLESIQCKKKLQNEGLRLNEDAVESGV